MCRCLLGPLVPLRWFLWIQKSQKKQMKSFEFAPRTPKKKAFSERVAQRQTAILPKQSIYLIKIISLSKLLKKQLR
jgi:hypothetical protein